MVRVLLYVLAAAALGACADEPVVEFSKGNHKFTAAIYKLIGKISKDNIIVCPISAQIVLAILCEGAVGPTLNELIIGTGLVKDRARARQAWRYIIPALNKSSETQVLTANRIYVANQFKLNSSYQDVAVDIYKVGVENVVFADNVKTANIINKWVEDHTNNKIHDLISPDQLSDDTRLVLINAMYFSGKWVRPFDTSLIKTGPFYAADNKTKLIDMLHSQQTAIFEQSDCLRAKFLTLPFKGSNITMTFILPNARDGLSRMEENIDEYLKPRKSEYHPVIITLPIFRIETAIDFVPILKALGIERAFDPIKANFSGITEKDEKLYVDFVLQKAFINVTASGVEAAAATAVGVSLITSVGGPKPPVQIFNADHSFFYYIEDSKQKIILFAGRFTGSSK